MRMQAPRCPQTERGDCRLCGHWVGWFDYADKAENERQWRQWQAEQQARHAERWQAQIDGMTLAPMRRD